MFATKTTSKLAQRSLDALRLTRSFLLLEDDYDVDWEVDRDEPQAHDHPHRAPLRGHGRHPRRVATRRAGEAPRSAQACTSPVGSVPDAIAPARRTRPNGEGAARAACVEASPRVGGHSEPRRTA